MTEDKPNTKKAIAPPSMSDERPEVEDTKPSWLRPVRIFGAIWWKPLTVGGILLTLSLWVGFTVSWLPVMWSFLAAGWFILVMWWAVRVYYHRIMEVRYSPGTDEITLVRHMVPMDLAPYIKVNGPRGMIRDIYGNTYDIVGEFDPVTLTGKGTWPNNWTPLHVLSHMGMAWKIVRIATRAIFQHSEGRIRAEAEFLADRALLAGLKDWQYYGDDGNVSKEELIEAYSKRLERDEAQKRRESRGG